MSCSEAHLKRCERYRKKHPERTRAANRKWNKSENGQRVRNAWAKSDEGKAWFRARSKELRDEVLEGYGGKCACCGESHRVFLAIDHVNGGGRAERRKQPPGIAFYNKIIRKGFPAEYRLLCHNCNMAFALLGACPHEGCRAEVVTP